MLNNVLSIQELSLFVNGIDLFNNLNISVLPSTILHISGVNGSGKTSLLRIIAGIQKPSKGKVLFGLPTTLGSCTIHNNCLYIGHNNSLKGELTVLENLHFWSRLYNSLPMLVAAIEYFQLHNIINTRCYKLSEGNKQKVALAKLLCCNANLWLLDEVETNLDKNNKLLIENLLRTKVASGAIVIHVSHNNIFKKSVELELG